MLQLTKRGGKGLKVGYIRTKKESPNPKMLSKFHEIGVDRIILDVIDINNPEQFRETLTLTISEMTRKDVLVVDSLDDLGDNVREVIDKLTLIEEKDVGIRLLSTEEDGEDNDIESNWRLHQRLRKQLLEVLKWVENKKNSEYRIKTAKAIQYMKAQRGSGRPKKYSKFAEDPEDRKKYFEVVEALKADIPIKRISEQVGLARNTIYTIKEELESEEKDLEE